MRPSILNSIAESSCIWLLSVLLLVTSGGPLLRAQPATTGQEGEGQLPPPRQVEGSPPPAEQPPIPPPPPLRLTDAIRRSLVNVQTVQANVAVRTATVGRFDALKQFVPLGTLPQLLFGIRRFNSGANQDISFPDVGGITPIAGQPGLDHIDINWLSFLVPLDPSGQITALPIAEEGIRTKLLMEQLVRRSQAALAIQYYFEAKQIQYGIEVARLAVNLADETLALTQRKLLKDQAYEVEVEQARVNAGRSRVFLADLEKSSRIRQRRLAVVLHQSRLLVPQTEPAPIRLDGEYGFDLNDPDLVDLRFVPDFPTCREEAVERAKRQRAEVRILVVGLRIAQLQQKRNILGLFGSGRLPLEFAYKDTSPLNGGIGLGALFGTLYTLPLTNVGLWASIRKGRLDVVQSQLDLEKGLLDVANDAGNAWDRWQQASKEWEQTEAELQVRRQLLERRERLYQQKQSIRLDVLGAQVNYLQDDASRWAAWYNLQLARLDVLRATELLLDYVEKAKIADLTAWQKAPSKSSKHHWWSRLTEKENAHPPEQEVSHAMP
jgi:outer membrane protein TolC